MILTKTDMTTEENVQQLDDLAEPFDMNMNSDPVTQASMPTAWLEASEQHHENRGDVIRRNPMGEKTSLISSLYLSDPEESEKHELERDSSSYLTLRALTSISTDLGILVEKVNSLEVDLSDSVNSAINREESIGDYIDRNVEALEHQMMATLKQFEEQQVECICCHDEKWKAELQWLKHASHKILAVPRSFFSFWA